MPKLFPRGIMASSIMITIDRMEVFILALNDSTSSKAKTLSFPNKEGASANSPTHSLQTSSISLKNGIYTTTLNNVNNLSYGAIFINTPTNIFVENESDTGLTIPLTLEIKGERIKILIQNPAYLAQLTRGTLNMGLLNYGQLVWLVSISKIMKNLAQDNITLENIMGTLILISMDLPFFTPLNQDLLIQGSTFVINSGVPYTPQGPPHTFFPSSSALEIEDR